MFFALRLSILMVILSLFSITPLAYGQEDTKQEKMGITKTADQCYEQKDQACLKELYSDIVSKPTDEKKKAVYLLGKLQLEAEDNLDEAKDTLMQTLMFAGEDYGEETVKDLWKLYERGDVEFDTFDCTVIKDDDCLQRIIDGDDPVKRRNAQYHLGKKLYKSDSKRSFALLSAAVETGHGSAECELAPFYNDDEEKDGVPEDYQKFIEHGLECLMGRPFTRLNTRLFEKYEKQKGHKAYAHRPGSGSYAGNRTSPEIAASHALNNCQLYAKSEEDASKCKVIHVDDLWVKDPKFADLDLPVKGIEGLASNSALKSFKEKYGLYETIKVFVQSRNGTWSWKSKGKDSNSSLEDIKEEALKACHESMNEKLKVQPCKIININGEWVQ